MPASHRSAESFLKARKNYKRRTVYTFVCNNCKGFFFTRRHPSEHQGFCSGGCFLYKGTLKNSHGYVLDRGNYVHRVNLESKLKRKLRKGETVHHIDHDRLNNSKSNLIPVSLKENNKLNSMIWKHIRKRITHKDLRYFTKLCLKRIRNE